MKRTYENPTTKVIILQEREYLLSLSGEISGYGKSSGGFSQSGDEEEESE